MKCTVGCMRIYGVEELDEPLRWEKKQKFKVQFKTEQKRRRTIALWYFSAELLISLLLFVWKCSVLTHKNKRVQQQHKTHTLKFKLNLIRGFFQTSFYSLLATEYFSVRNQAPVQWLDSSYVQGQQRDDQLLAGTLKKQDTGQETTTSAFSVQLQVLSRHFKAEAWTFKRVCWCYPSGQTGSAKHVERDFPPPLLHKTVLLGARLLQSITK